MERLTKQRRALIALCLVSVGLILAIFAKSQSGKPLNAWVAQGDWIAFSCGNNDATEIYLIRPDGTDTQQVTHNGLLNQSPVWTPDGQWIVFAARNSDATFALMPEKYNSQLYRIRPNGADVEQLTNDDFDYNYPALSPDGKQITFSSNRLGIGQWAIYQMDLVDRSIQPLASQDNLLGTSFWSPDAKWILVSIEGSAIGKMRADGSELSTLIVGSFAYGATWSPDGQWIAFSYSPEMRGSNVYLMRASGAQLHPLTNLQSPIWSPTWSPDGKWIAFSTGSQLDKIQPDGNNLQKLTDAKCETGGVAWFTYSH